MGIGAELGSDLIRFSPPAERKRKGLIPAEIFFIQPRGNFMNGMLLLVGMSLSLGAKLAALVYLTAAYSKSRRRSALLFALAFLFASIQVAGDILGIEWLSAVMEAVMASAFFYAAVLLAEEEFSSPPSVRGYLAATPVVLTFYILLAEQFNPSPSWLATVGVAYAVSGLFLVFSGGLIWELLPMYPDTVRLLSISTVLYGLHEMDYPLLRPVQWFAPIGFSISALLTVLIAYAMVAFVRSERFLNLNIKVDAKKELEKLQPGVTFMSPERYRNFISSIADFPALAFVRNPDIVPEAWQSYLLSNTPTAGSIPPTNLPKITELINVYLHSLKEKGAHGVVVLDGIEYLLIYNGFETVIKFLNNVRDIAVLHGGTVVVPTDRHVWDERQWALLERLVG